MVVCEVDNLVRSIWSRFFFNDLEIPLLNAPLPLDFLDWLSAFLDTDDIFGGTFECCWFGVFLTFFALPSGVNVTVSSICRQRYLEFLRQLGK